MEKVKNKFHNKQLVDYTTGERKIILTGRYIMGIMTIFWIGFIISLFIWKNPIL